MDGEITPSTVAARLPRSVPILIRTNIGTNISFTVSEEDIIRDVKRKITMEHASIHPDLGDIKIQALKVKWGKSLFSLSDSMCVSDAFHWIKGAWVLYVDAISTATGRDMMATSMGRMGANEEVECAAAGDMVATSMDKMGASGVGYTSSLKIAYKNFNDDALGLPLVLHHHNQDIAIGRSKSLDSKHHQRDPSVSMDKIIDASKGMLIAEESVLASGNMDVAETTTASGALEIGKDNSTIYGNPVVATELANPLSEPQQNLIQTKQMKKNINSSGPASEKDNEQDRLFDSSNTGVCDLHTVRTLHSPTLPDSSLNGNALTVSREFPVESSKVNLHDVLNGTSFIEVVDKSPIPEGTNIEIPRKHRQKNSHSQKNLNGKQGMTDASSADHEYAIDMRGLVEESSPLSELMDNKQCLCPHLDSMDKVTEKSDSVLLAAETVGGVAENLLDGMETTDNPIASDIRGSKSEFPAKSLETLELADQSVDLHQNATQTKRNKKRRIFSEPSDACVDIEQNGLPNIVNKKRRKFMESSAASVDIEQNGLPNVVMTVAIDSHPVEMPISTVASDPLLEGATFSLGTENIEVEPPGRKSTDKDHVDEFADISRNPEGTILQIPSKHKRKSSKRQKKIRSHETLDAVSAASSDLSNKRQPEDEQNNENIKAMDMDSLESVKESLAEENFETRNSIERLDGSQMLLKKASDSLQKESDTSPLLDETPIGDEKNCNSLVLDESAALLVPMGKRRYSKRKKSETVENTNVTYLALDKKQQQNEQYKENFEATDMNSSESLKDSLIGVQVAQENLEPNYSVKGLDDSQVHADTDLLRKVGDSHQKESGTSPVLDKTPIANEKNCSPLLLDNSATVVSREKNRLKKKKKSENLGKTNMTSLELEKGSSFGIKGTREDSETTSFNDGLGSNQVYAHNELPCANDSRDKQSNELLDKAPDDPCVDEQTCRSILLDKSAASSDAKDKKQQRNRKSGKLKGENMNSPEIEKACSLENQQTKESLDGNCLNEALESNADTDLPREINQCHGEKSDASPLLDKTTNLDSPGVPRSIDKSVFMEIFCPQALETSLALEENPSALNSDTAKPPKEQCTSLRKSKSQKKDGSADTISNHIQAMHRKKSRVDKSSNRKQSSGLSIRQDDLHEDDTAKTPAINYGISPADGELDRRSTQSKSGRRRVKSSLSKDDIFSDMDSPKASGIRCEKIVSKSRGDGLPHKGKDTNIKFDDIAYPGQPGVGVTTPLKTVPSLSSSGTEDNSPNSTSRYRVAVRHKASAKSSRTAHQDGDFSAREMLFNSTASKEHGVDKPAASYDSHGHSISNSRSDLNPEGEQEIQLPSAQVIDYRDSSAAKNVDKKNRSGTRSMSSRSTKGQSKLGAVLRNTRTYKKASEIIASQSQELDVDDESPDLVPESQF